MCMLKLLYSREGRKHKNADVRSPKRSEVPNFSSCCAYLHWRLHGGHGLVDGGEGRDGRHEDIVADQHVALHQSVCQRGGWHCDVGGHLVLTTQIGLNDKTTRRTTTG